MKKFIVACLAIAVYTNVIAQVKPKEAEVVVAKPKLAIKAGANMSTARVYQNDVKLDTKFVTGYGLGVLFQIPFEGLLYFSPAIAYNKRGYIYTPKSGAITEYENAIHYIDIAPNLSIFIPAGKSAISLSAGPHLSVAIAGTEKTTTGTTTSSNAMQFSMSNSYGFVDLGVGTGIGFHTKKLLVEASFQLGLANINNDAEFDKRNIRNRMFSLQVGYYLK